MDVGYAPNSVHLHYRLFRRMLQVARADSKTIHPIDRNEHGKAIILAMSETISLAAVKDRFSEIVDRVNKQHDRVIVTRNGVPAVVLVSVEELESLEETLEILSDQSAMDAIRESEREVASNLDIPVTEEEARTRWAR